MIISRCGTDDLPAIKDSLKGAGAPPSGPSPAHGGAKVVTPAIAKQYLAQAKGNKEQARAMAKKDGYGF